MFKYLVKLSPSQKRGGINIITRKSKSDAAIDIYNFKCSKVEIKSVNFSP